MKRISKGTAALLATLFLVISLVGGTPSAFADNGQLGPAQALFKAGKYKETIAACDKLLKSDANIIGAHYLRAISYHAMKNTGEAAKEYQWVVRSGNPLLGPQAQRGLDAIEGKRAAADAKARHLKPKVYDFYATWCVPCKELEPILNEAMVPYRNTVDFQRVDGEQASNQALRTKYQVNNYPTLIFAKPDGTFHSRLCGKYPKETIQQSLQVLVTVSNR
jgi:Thiol-disulfide isomerase and thioredoxins